MVFVVEIFSDVQAVSLDTENNEVYSVSLSFKEDKTMVQVQHGRSMEALI